MENVEQEFLSVIREYERVIYKVCYLYTTPNATLNDLYQEVVLNIWKAFPKFRRECKISTWIYRIALNTCISFIRKEKNIPEIVTLTQEADCSEEDDETQAMLQQLYRMINRLGQLEKSIILLYLEEKSYEDISEITGLTVTNVATKLNRIKDKLKKMKKAVAEEQQDIDTLFCQTIERRKRQEKILAEQGLLSKEKQKTDKNITKWLDERKWKLKEAGFEAVKEDFYRETLKLKHQEEQIRMLLDKELGDVKNSSKTGQELPLFLSMLSQNEKIAEFIAEHRCESYLKESKALLLQEREAALKEEIQAFQTN